MATSPIYSWPEPDNTDLVKNGALAIRTMGNAIDTTMGTMTPKSTYTAKGSIAAATAASTPANLAVGANNTFLRANSSTATGLEYAGTYTTFTPSWINLTLGNGTTSGRYLQIGKFIHVWANLIFGTTTVITAGVLRMTLPVNFVGDTAQIHNGGSLILLDNGTTSYPGTIQMITTQAILEAQQANATYLIQAGVSSIVPHTWGSTDEITISMVYEVA